MKTGFIPVFLLPERKFFDLACVFGTFAVPNSYDRPLWTFPAYNKKQKRG